MKLDIAIVDAFTTRRFSGNQAAVVLLDAWIDEALMQDIARENNLSETAFLVGQGTGVFAIRWFSPLKEIAFCGHATLASAHVIMARTGCEEVVFTASAVGEVRALRTPEGLIEMAFPNLAPSPVEQPPLALLEGLGAPVQEWLCNRQAWFAVMENEARVRAVRPDLERLRTLAPLDVVVTAPGEQHDFVSRYFWPANGGEEDPVTGSIHAGLAPYWAQRLGRDTLVALQASARTGDTSATRLAPAAGVWLLTVMPPKAPPLLDELLLDPEEELLELNDEELEEFVELEELLLSLPQPIKPVPINAATAAPSPPFKKRRRCSWRASKMVAKVGLAEKLEGISSPLLSILSKFLFSVIGFFLRLDGFMKG